MNKRNNTIRGELLLVAAALMFSSCAETPGPEEGGYGHADDQSGTPALTRSAIDNAGDMQKEENAFSVWGWYANAGGTESGTVFNNKRVFWSAANPGWGYEGNPLLASWPRLPLLRPLSLNRQAGHGRKCGMCGERHNHHYQLRRHARHRLDDSTADSPNRMCLTKDPGPVTFTFAHQLARLSFAVKAVDGGYGHSLQGERRDLEG